MDDHVFMVPAPGVRLTHPAGSPKQMQVIPPGGEWIRVTEYWRRREADGSIVRGTPPTEPDTKQPALRAVKGQG